MSGTEIFLLFCVVALVLFNVFSTINAFKVVGRQKNELIGLYERYQAEAQRYIKAQQDWQGFKSAIAKTLRDAEASLTELREELDRKEILESAYKGSLLLLREYSTFATNTAEKCGVVLSGIDGDAAMKYFSDQMSGVIKAYNQLPPFNPPPHEKKG